MANSVSEQLAIAIKAGLEYITVAHGYTYNVLDVVRPTIHAPVDPAHLRIVLTSGVPARAPDNDLQGNPPARAWREPYSCAFFAMPSETDTAASAWWWHTLAADMTKALMLAPQWGGLAIESEIIGMRQLEPDELSYGGAEVTLEVLYRTPENDPYTAR